MKTLATSLASRGKWKQQRGAIAITLGLSILALFGFMALAVDLGRTYLVRTELQNAADAAALAGAKELNQTAAGVTSAVNRAIAMAAQNSFNFSSTVTITIANIQVGTCPENGCMVDASTVTTDGAAAGKAFLKVDIPSGSLSTFFARLPKTIGGSGTPFTNTYGLAVAGPYIGHITPIAICAIPYLDGAVWKSRPKAEALAGTNELAQFGFRRGVSYNIFDLAPIAPGNPYLLNPVDKYPNPCDSSNSSANFTAPFVCNGEIAVLSSTPGTVYGNTGVSAGKIEAALNSRFNMYGGASVCTPDLAPPDINIKKYFFNQNQVVDWMTPYPSIQAVTSATLAIPPAAINVAGDYGVLWSYSRAVRASGTSPNYEPGTEFATSDWSTLYPVVTGLTPTTTSAFPTAGSPYLESGNPKHYDQTASGIEDRRVLNLAIADCPAVTGGGSCTQIPILGVGRFFMQVPANLPKKIEVEFAGLIEPTVITQIKLYR